MLISEWSTLAEVAAIVVLWLVPNDCPIVDEDARTVPVSTSTLDEALGSTSWFGEAGEALLVLRVTSVLTVVPTVDELDPFAVVTPRLILAAELSDVDKLETVPVEESVELEALLFEFPATEEASSWEEVEVANPSGT